MSIPIVPCRIAPRVPSPIYKWILCSLNSNITNNANLIKEYFGYTTSLIGAKTIILFISFIVTMWFFHLITRKRKKF